MRTRHLLTTTLATGALLASTLALVAGTPAGAITVGNEAGLRTALADLTETEIVLSADITVTCTPGQLERPGAASPLVLDGGGFTITQTCAGSRVLQVGSTMTIQDVTITGGDETTLGVGGGIYSQADLILDGVQLIGNAVGTGTGGVGGGLFANATTQIIRSTIDDNTARGGTSIFGGLGGGLAGNGNYTITESTISGNTAGGAENNGGGAGGIFGNGSYTLIRSTVANNTAAPGSITGSGNGGGISTNDIVTLISSTVTGNIAVGAESRTGGVGAGGDLLIVNSTIAGNSSALGGANIDGATPGFSVVTITNSVVARPLGGSTNCGIQDPAANLSGGYNFADDDSCALGDPTDADGDGGAPLLGAPADNGGPTPTRLPGAGSPLLDAIPAAACQAGDAADTPTDQRGITRPQNTSCDIGAVEVVPTPVVPPVVPVVPGDPATPVAVDPRYTG